jgi:3-oxoacyl-[acyl-carrier-protein] synthase II
MLSEAFSITASGICAGKRAFDSTLLSADDFSLHSEHCVPIVTVDESSEQIVNNVIAETSLLQRADRSLHLALACGRRLRAAKQFTISGERCGVSIGCARGSTGLFEQRFNEWQSGEVRLSSTTSPFTTAGSLTSFVATDLGCDGFNLSHSMTCSSALQAVTNALAWISAGFCERVIAGGVEAPLTAFTIAQMRALSIYTDQIGSPHPSTPCALSATKNSFMLGEGGGLFMIERGRVGNALAHISGVGFCQEVNGGLTGISPSGEGFQRAMHQALSTAPGGKIPDLVILHCPGTIQGDRSELAAVQALFPGERPAIFSNKWQVGHTLGASGALSMHTAIEALRTGVAPEFPYPVEWKKNSDLLNGRRVKSVLVNAAGFGGNISSILLTHPKQF